MGGRGAATDLGGGVTFSSASDASEEVSLLAMSSTVRVESSIGVRGGPAEGSNEEVEDRGETRADRDSGKLSSFVAILILRMGHQV